MDVNWFRKVLKQAREGEVLRSGKLGRPALSKLTASTGAKPVNSQTIKNIEDGTNVDPGIATVSRIVEAMGLSLSEFFLQIERQTDGDLPARAIAGRSERTPGGEATATRGHRPSVPTDHDIRAAVGQALLRAAAALTDTAAAGTTESADREVPRARVKKRARR